MFDKITESVKLMESSLNVDLTIVVDHTMDDQYFLCQNLAVAKLLVSVLKFLNSKSGQKDPVEILDRELANASSFNPGDYISEQDMQRLAKEAKLVANADQAQAFFDDNEKFFDNVMYDDNSPKLEFEPTSDEKQQWHDDEEAEKEREWHRRHPGN